MKNLQSYGVQELTAKQAEEIDGGGDIAYGVGWFFGTIGSYIYHSGAMGFTV